ncbi:MAG TPA: SMP-30/gluconolactonase/LRE family protein [Anaeromyxobacteraceae bacterium]|nr:SMP-30/gluconolactonase/LRE family protein [Anaeromyxobacteraceae bacterium]
MRIWLRALAVCLAALAALPTPTRAWSRGRARVFATLPAGSAGPEGLEVDGKGNVYVTTFGFTASGPATGSGQLYVFSEHGHLLRQVSIAGASPHLLGLRFHPATGALLVIDFGAGVVLDVDSHTGASTVFMTLPSPLPHPALGAGLNDVTFDAAGNVYVSDSFQGIVWKTGPGGGVASVWVDSDLLRTSGVPPFGANGLRFNRAETALFVANTGNDTVVRVPVASGAGTTSGPVAGTPAVFTNGINGADGLLIDDDDNLWVVANQADEIVVVDPTGKAISKLGDFGGLKDGTPIQMLFPASLRFLGDDLLVTNLSLDLRLFDPSYAAVDSEWCAQVTRYTVVKIRARIRGCDEPSEWDPFQAR